MQGKEVFRKREEKRKEKKKRKNKKKEKEWEDGGGTESKRKRSCAATLSDLYPSTCLVWEAVTGVYKL